MGVKFLREFAKELEREGSGYVEGLNRMLDEEFVEYREWMLKDDLEGFHRELMRYLIWYNVWRGHKVSLEMYRLLSGFVTNFTRILLSLKSYGLIQFLDIS